MLGITTGKYAGVNSSLINPSVPVLSPYYFDLNIVTAHLFFENNYLYIPRHDNKFNVISSIDFKQQQSPYNKRVFDYYTPEDKNGYIVARVLGPSVCLMIGRQAFGFTTALRSVTSLTIFQ